MTRRAIFGIVAAFMFNLAMSVVSASAADLDEQVVRPALARVRSNNAPIAAVMAEAARRSPVFRGLVETIDASDGLVYVDQGTCGHGVRACLVLDIQVAGPHRVLRILVDAHKSRNACYLMASIGHELQHAIEVLREPGVRNFHAAFSFYEREGGINRDSGRFETAAAMRAGLEVEREVCAR